MTNFDNFYTDLLELIKKYKDNDTYLKIESDPENQIIKIFGDKLTSLERARNGLSDVSELSYTVAEHHPYWNLLNHSSEITKTLLEKWTDSLSSDDFSDIDWALKKFKETFQKIKDSDDSVSI